MKEDFVYPSRASIVDSAEARPRDWLRNRDMLCFSHDWSGDPLSKTHLMRLLSQDNRILWVNSIGMRRPTISHADLHRIVSKLQQSLSGCKEVEPNIIVMNPLVLPLPGIAIADCLNAKILATSLLDQGLAKRESLDLIYSDLVKVMDAAVEFATNAPYPNPEEVDQDIYA